VHQALRRAGRVPGGRPTASDAARGIRRLSPGVGSSSSGSVPIELRQGRRLAAAQLEFVGVLMGVGLRVGFLFPLAFPAAAWKLLAGETIALGDLEGMDVAFARRIREIREAALAA